MRTAAAIDLVTAARTDADLFGTDQPARRYRELVAALHPDRLPADPAVRAEALDAFIHVTTRWQARHVTVLGDYRLGAPAHSGDLADLYDVGADRLLKLPRRPTDNDLMAREAHALRTIAERGDPRYLPYVPRLVDEFPHRDAASGTERRINVLATAPGLHDLDEVRRAYPDGLDARDAAWMWRRLLVVLGLAHRAGVVHGAVLPRHVLIEPAAHGVVLVDWCFSAPAGTTIPAMVPGHDSAWHMVPGHDSAWHMVPGHDSAWHMVPGHDSAWYPEEVTRKRPCGPGTDIAMASRCMSWLMGSRAPRELHAFAEGCRQRSLDARPDDAWRLLRELDQVLDRLYGPRTFRPFTLTP